MELTDKQKSLIRDLRELLEYGSSQLSGISLKQKGTSLKKRLLFYMMSATQSYGEGILKIMTSTQDHQPIYDKPALTLLRSMTENLWNLGYIYACDTQEHAALFYIDWAQDTLKFANRYKCLMIKYPKDKYPDWNLSFSNKERAIEEPNDWDELIKDLKNTISKSQRRYKLTPDSTLPPIEQRCIQQDDYLKSKGILVKGNSLEVMYVTYYRYFSQIAHLTAASIGTFMNNLPDGSFDIRADSSPQEIETLVPATYPAYLAILRLFLKKFDAYSGNNIRKYKKVAQSMIA